MKYVFRPVEKYKVNNDWIRHDWYERTSATPSNPKAGFALKDFRWWMMTWVFK